MRRCSNLKADIGMLRDGRGGGEAAGAIAPPASGLIAPLARNDQKLRAARDIDVVIVTWIRKKLMDKPHRKSLARILASTALAATLWTTGAAAADWQRGAKPDPDATTLITNVSIFNGTDETLITGKDVVVKGAVIDSIIDMGGDTSGYTEVIDGKGGYLSPGLIDMHWHMSLGMGFEESAKVPIQYAAFTIADDAHDFLLRGFTTSRDAAGPVFGVRRAIDEGLIPGPRIYPSGIGLSQYSGHIDFRNPNFMPAEFGGPVDAIEQINFAYLVNSPDQVRAAVRHNLYLGATQIKMAASGSVSGVADPLYVLEFTKAEIEAAVEAAADFGTYVQVHAHNAASIKRALEAGVMTIEHGSCIDEEGMKMLVEKGAYFTPTFEVGLSLESSPDALMAEKAKEADACVGNAFKLAKKHGAKVLFGTDMIFSKEARDQQAKELTVRKPFFSSAEIMIQATGNGGEALWTLTGKRNPYGRVGVIQKGAMADIIIFGKNPLEDVSIVEDAENNLNFIMKDGLVHKNALD